MNPRPLLLAIVLCAGCGGSGSAPQTPTSPGPAPTTPTSQACSAIGSHSTSLTAIVNGADCDSSSGSVVLLNLFASDGFGIGQCSGTVIGARTVLTAAHCLAGVATARIFTGSFPQVAASHVAAHSGYNQSSGSAFDVGIITADEDIGRPAIPLLTSRDARVGETAVVAGWGKDASQNSATMRAGSTLISVVTSDVLQTQFSSSTAFVCQGDSGGPLLLQEGGAWAVAGVISANTNTACNTGNNFYAATRNSSVLSFITQRAPDLTTR